MRQVARVHRFIDLPVATNTWSHAAYGCGRTARLIFARSLFAILSRSVAPSLSLCVRRWRGGRPTSQGSTNAASTTVRRPRLIMPCAMQDTCTHGALPRRSTCRQIMPHTLPKPDACLCATSARAAASTAAAAVHCHRHVALRPRQRAGAPLPPPPQRLLLWVGEGRRALTAWIATAAAAQTLTQAGTARGSSSTWPRHPGTQTTPRCTVGTGSTVPWPNPCCTRARPASCG